MGMILEGLSGYSVLWQMFLLSNLLLLQSRQQGFAGYSGQRNDIRRVHCELALVTLEAPYSQSAEEAHGGSGTSAQ